MVKRILFATSLVACVLFAGQTVSAQSVVTAKSLFLLADSLQVREIFSENADMTAEVGHCGPAVENTYSMFRLLFNDSGAVDVYSKTGRGMELLAFHWYPTARQREDYATGIDQYVVGNTLGLGGFALWDGSKVVNLVATRGRRARAGETKTGSYAELIAYGVLYKGEYVDISLRVETSVKTRRTTVTASEINGKKVQFVSGVNYHEDAAVEYDLGHIAVWGVHPSETAPDPKPVGAGLFYSNKTFPTIEQTDDMVRIISKEVKTASVQIIAASTIEAEINTRTRFMNYMAGAQNSKAKTSRKSGPKKGLQVNYYKVH